MNILLLLAIYIVCINTADLPFTVNGVLQSNMVLQRGPKRSTLWGTGKTNNEIYVVLENTKYTAIINTLGQWKVYLNPHQKSVDGIQIVISNNYTSDIIKLDNILFGDVYLCSGQSNMVRSVDIAYGKEEAYAEAYKYSKYIRIMTVGQVHSPNQVVTDLKGKLDLNWSMATADKIKVYSAVCYYFGRKVHMDSQIPIGLITSSWGGALMEVFASNEARQKCSQLSSGTGIPNAYPGTLWNGMIYPLLPYTINGVVWYQGEANVNNEGDFIENTGYQCLLPELIYSWRSNFHQFGDSDINFYFGMVLLSGYCATTNHLCTNDLRVHDLRWAQTIGYGYAPNPILSNVFIANAVDLPDDLITDPPGGDIHSRYKLDIGVRLGSAALGLIYQAHHYTITGPIVSRILVTSTNILIIIDSLSIPNENIIMKSNFGFEIEVNNERWEEIETTEVLNNIIYFQNPYGSKDITGMRYLWKNNPCCKAAYGTVTPFTCQQKVCGIYTNIIDIPLNPFIYKI